MVKKIIILMVALCLVLVGISCKKKPTEAGGMELARPDDKNDAIGGDGSLKDPELIKKYKDEFINIRLISDSGDGVAYYRAPVIVTYGANGMGMGIFYEKRYGQGGAGDVGVDGKASVDIVYMANSRGGDNLNYSSDNKVGSDPSASTGAQYSKGSPVVFSSGKDNNISVIASAGTGASGNGGSELKISKGTASGDTINFGAWDELNITYSDKKGSEAIREYAKKIDSGFHGFYTRWGRGKIDPSDSNKWVFTLWLFGGANSKGAVLVLYSTNAGTNWTFGPHYILNENGPHARATALSVSGNEVKVSLVPHTANRPLGIAQGTLEDCSTTPKQLTKAGDSSFNDSYNNSEISSLNNSSYFINTRERNAGKLVNGFVVNKYLTIALLNEPGDGLQQSQQMIMSRLAGSGSVAVLSDGTILTVAEEAFAEKVREGENRFNLVQRRFTKDYLTSHERIPQEFEYYNPNYPENSY